MTPSWVQGLRFARCLLHLLQGVLTAFFIFPLCSKTQRIRLTRIWSHKILIILNILTRIEGRIAPANSSGVMFVANHISWLDIWLLNSLQPCRFISKSEVKAWPVIGYLATRAGTLYIERTRKRHAATLNQDVAAALQAGDYVALFPEGTTSDGRQLRKFHASLMQPAVEAHALLQPVAIRYVLEDGSIDLRPAYIDDISLLESVRRILRARQIRAEIEFLPPIPTQGLTRRAAAQAAQQAIASALHLPCHGTTPETARDLPAAAR